MCGASRYDKIVIKSFVHKGLRSFFETGSTAGIQVKHSARLQNVLGLLNRAKEIRDMDLPGYNLHSLKGDLKGFWSVKISGNWRIIFRFEGGHAYVVDYLDYH